MLKDAIEEYKNKLSNFKREYRKYIKLLKSDVI